MDTFLRKYYLFEIRSGSLFNLLFIDLHCDFGLPILLADFVRNPGNSHPSSDHCSSSWQQALDHLIPIIPSESTSQVFLRTDFVYGFVLLDWEHLTTFHWPHDHWIHWLPDHWIHSTKIRCPYSLHYTIVSSSHLDYLRAPPPSASRQLCSPRLPSACRRWAISFRVCWLKWHRMALSR